jgi:hypothetical protein
VLVEVILEVFLVPCCDGAVGVLARRPEVGGALAVEVGLGIEPVVEESQKVLQQGGVWSVSCG